MRDFVKMKFLEFMETFGVTEFDPEPCFKLKMRDLKVNTVIQTVSFIHYGLEMIFEYQEIPEEDKRVIAFEHSSTTKWPRGAFDKMTPDQQAAFKRTEAVNDKIFELKDMLEEMNFDLESRGKINQTIKVLEEVRKKNLPKRIER